MSETTYGTHHRSIMVDRIRIFPELQGVWLCRWDFPRKGQSYVGHTLQNADAKTVAIVASTDYTTDPHWVMVDRCDYATGPVTYDISPPDDGDRVVSKTKINLRFEWE